MGFRQLPGGQTSLPWRVVLPNSMGTKASALGTLCLSSADCLSVSIIISFNMVNMSFSLSSVSYSSELIESKEGVAANCWLVKNSSDNRCDRHLKCVYGGVAAEGEDGVGELSP